MCNQTDTCDQRAVGTNAPHLPPTLKAAASQLHATTSGVSLHALPLKPQHLVVTLALVGTFVACLALIRVWQLVKFRHVMLTRFKRGNIRVADNPGLFSGHLFNEIVREDNLKHLAELHRRLGKSYALFYGPDPWLVTVDLDLIQRVFVTEGSVHVDGTLLQMPFVTELNHSLAQVRGNTWRRLRKLMAPSFTAKHMKSDKVFEEIEAVCDLFMDLVQAHKQEAPDKNNVVIDVNHAFKRFSMEVTFRVAYGRAHCERLLPNERDELVEWMDEGSEMIMGRVVGLSIMFGQPLRRLLGLLTRFTPLGSCIRYIHSISADCLESRRAMRKEEEADKQAGGVQNDRKMIDRLIDSFEQGRLDDATLRANLFFLLLAGFETSASTLIFMFWLLATNQDKQERLRRELMASDAQQAQYLDWVLHETLRLYPAVPAPIGRILEHDIEHENMRIPRGCTVVANIWSLHRWPEHWGHADDLHAFRPERFGETEQKSHPLRFFAFAAGPRYCIGQHLAVAEIKALAARLLMKYRVSLAPGVDARPINAVTPNMIHFIIRQPVELAFTEISSL